MTKFNLGKHLAESRSTEPAADAISDPAIGDLFDESTNHIPNGLPLDIWKCIEDMIISQRVIALLDASHLPFHDVDAINPITMTLENKHSICLPAQEVFSTQVGSGDFLGLSDHMADRVSKFFLNQNTAYWRKASTAASLRVTNDLAESLRMFNEHISTRLQQPIRLHEVQGFYTNQATKKLYSMTWQESQVVFVTGMLRLLSYIRDRGYKLRLRNPILYNTRLKMRELNQHLIHAPAAYMLHSTQALIEDCPLPVHELWNHDSGDAFKNAADFNYWRQTHAYATLVMPNSERLIFTTASAPSAAYTNSESNALIFVGTEFADAFPYAKTQHAIEFDGEQTTPDLQAALLTPVAEELNVIARGVWVMLYGLTLFNATQELGRGNHRTQLLHTHLNPATVRIFMHELRSLGI